MRNSVRSNLFPVTLCMATIVAIISPLESRAAGERNAQPTLDTRVVPILEVEGLKFKDLNKNNLLDKYEDWRLPVEARIADLISQMTVEEKIGQLFHPRLYTPKDGGMNADAEKMILGLHLGHFLTTVLCPRTTSRNGRIAFRR